MNARAGAISTLTAPRLRVLLLGATGVFGRRIAHQLAREPGIDLVIAGSCAARLGTLFAELPAVVELTLMQPGEPPTAATLVRLDIGLLIDARGTPEPAPAVSRSQRQTPDLRCPQAALAAGCHYADLGESRTWVEALSSLDSAARAAGVALLAGVSTTPALTHAVLDHLVCAWQRVDQVQVAICPGNRAPRGLATVRAVLQYVGQQVRVFRNGRWQIARGWDWPSRTHIAGVGTRLVSLCDTVDLDLLPRRFKPHRGAELRAGLELPELHLGLWLASLAVRLGLLRSLLPLADRLRRAADLLRTRGSDVGGMRIDVEGLDPGGQRRQVCWSLVAPGNRGPSVPTLAVLVLARQVATGRLRYRGAGPCVGLLALAEFARDFERLGLDIRSEGPQGSRLLPPPGVPADQAAAGAPSPPGVTAPALRSTSR